jgi:hypothetical protein
MPEIVVKAKETPTQQHRIDQEAKQLKTRTVGRLVTCRVRQSQFGVVALFTGALTRKSCYRAPRI